MFYLRENANLCSEHKEELINFLPLGDVGEEARCFSQSTDAPILFQSPMVMSAPNFIYSGPTAQHIVPPEDDIQSDANLKRPNKRKRRRKKRFVKHQDVSQQFSESTLNLYAEDKDECLQMALIDGDVEMFERVLRLGANIDNEVEIRDEKLSPVEYACNYGYWQILEIILRSRNAKICGKPLLSSVVRNMDLQATENRDYEKCLELLLKREDIELEHCDDDNRTALHYAVLNHHQNAITALLEKGAYIGVKSNFGEYSISHIHPKILENHLDNCITTVDTIDDKTFAIEMNYRNLVPLSCKQKRDTCNANINEMAPIAYISQSKDLRHLLKHPLLQSFLFLKWHRLALTFISVLFVYCTFSASIWAYIYWYYFDMNDSNDIKQILFYISFPLTVLVFLCEVFQLMFSLKYLNSFENFLVFLKRVVFLVMLALWNLNVTESHRRIIAAVNILLVAWEIFIWLGYWEIIDFPTNFIMLKTVLISFIKGFIFYVIILVAFALCFFVLLSESSGSKATVTKLNDSIVLPGQNQTEDEEDPDLNKFVSFWPSLIKIFVMFSGEFEAGSINFDLNAFSYLIFFVFIFLMSTVLFNLLNGLAISDTQVGTFHFSRSHFLLIFSISKQEIKSKAELTNLIQRVNLLSKYEKISRYLSYDIKWL